MNGDAKRKEKIDKRGKTAHYDYKEMQNNHKETQVTTEWFRNEYKELPNNCKLMQND